jgi:two-component system LytT family response regulator
LKTHFYILLLLLVTGDCLFGQAPAFVHYETGNGLPANEIYEMKQYRTGFLWIGCQAGLVRYDGNQFRLLLCSRNRGTAISNLQEDSYGRIRCINFSGQIFYTEGGSLRLFEPWEKNYCSGFADIAIDGNDQLYICNQQNRIYKYDIRSGKPVIAVGDSLFKRSLFIAADFPDIEMPGYNGFQLLEFFDGIRFEVVFVTAYSEFALKAFRVSAVDYLLKPLQIDQLIRAVEKAEKYGATPSSAKGWKHRKPTWRNKILVSRNIRDYENQLTTEEGFFRTHRSFLVNTRYVRSIFPDGNEAEFIHKQVAAVARERKQEFSQFMRKNTTN